MPRSWLRHPPRAIASRPSCPSGLPRFASLVFARDALLPVAVSVAGLSAAGCGLCGGVHIVPVAAEGPSVPP
jgi:hypothetical protein